MNKQLCLVALQLAVTDAKIPVMEVPRYSNRGKRVDEYQITAGVTPPEPYCASAVYTWFHEACAMIGAINPLLRSGYCPDVANHLKKTGRRRLRAVDARPGDVILFWMSAEGRYAHAGIVLKNNGDGTLQTVEANTNNSGAREGDGVYFKHRRVAGTRHCIGDMQDIFGTVKTAPVRVVDPINITQILHASALGAAVCIPVKVTIDNVPTSIPAHSYLDRTYVAIAPYAEAMQGKELGHGVFDGHTSTLNLITE